MLKKLYIFIIIAYLIGAFYIQATMGDSSNTPLKNITVYGQLQTYILPAKKVEQITFWNKQLKTHVYEAPTEWCDIENKKQENGNAPKQLNFNPSEQGTVATIELQEIQSITTPESQNTIIFSKPDKTTQEFILIKVTFHGNTSRCYLVDKRDKLFCKERNGNEIVELEVPILSIKLLTIDGYSAMDKQCS